MNIEEIREYCISKKGVEETFPFDDTTLVMKVMNKIFCLLSLEGDNSMNLKCEPEKAIELRERFDFVVPGYHMNKRHWNTVYFTKTLDSNLLRSMIDDSYNLIVEGLPKKKRKILASID